MKYIFQLPIFLLMLWASGVSYASSCIAFSEGDIEAFVTKSCSDIDPSGSINLVLNGGKGPYDIVYLDEQDQVIKSTSVVTNDTDEDIFDLVPGLYKIRVTDAMCATAVMSVYVGVFVFEEYKLSVNITNSCSAESNDGSIELSYNGTQKLTAVWVKTDNLKFPFIRFIKSDNDLDIHNLGVGTYYLSLYLNGCYLYSNSYKVEGEIYFVDKSPILYMCIQHRGEIRKKRSGCTMVKIYTVQLRSVFL